MLQLALHRFSHTFLTEKLFLIEDLLFVNVIPYVKENSSSDDK